MSKLRIDQVNEESLRLYKFGSDDIAYSFDLTLGTVTVNGSLPSDLIVSSAVYCTPVTVQCNTINCTTIDCTTIQCTTVNCTTIDCTTIQCSGRCTANCLECNNCKHQSTKCDFNSKLCVNCYHCYDCQNYT
jgi:hypothetical protein|nr:MAG TPA: hypothetical protein [Caudoviricetes sp.]